MEALASMLGPGRGIEPKSMLNAAGLAVSGKVFAFEHDGALVLKLPRDHVEGLVASGAGRSFGTPGRIMKEWVAVPTQRPVDQAALAEAALEFVARSIKPAGR
jgi:hypothetical protein